MSTHFQRWTQSMTTQWFLVPQGTGIVALVLHQLDYQFAGLRTISYVFWVLTITLLLGFLATYLARCIFFPSKVLRALQHETGEVAGLSSICIAYTSIIQMTALTCVKSWGKGWGTATYALWWTNVVMTVCVVVGVPFVYLWVHPPGVSGLTPASQLPMIAALTVAAGGGTVCQSAELDPQFQIPAIVVSYLFVGVGLPLAFALDVLFWARLLDSSSSPPDNPQASFQCMILCGPWGQASFALQILGSGVLSGSFKSAASGIFLAEKAAAPVGYASIFAGLLCWGAGTFWWLFAIAAILKNMIRTGGTRRSTTDERPTRVDSAYDTEPDGWMQSDYLLCRHEAVSNGCELGIGVKDGKAVGNGQLERASWDEAMDLIVAKSKALQKHLTNHSIAFYTTGQLFLEEYYALAMGTIRLFCISGTNPLVSLPNLPRIRRLLTDPEPLVVVQDLCMTETAALADAVLPAGRAILKACHYSPPVDAEFPLRLAAGRNVCHFHTRTKTGRTALQKACPEPEVRISNKDAAAAGISDGSMVAVRSRRGEFNVASCCSLAGETVTTMAEEFTGGSEPPSRAKWSKMLT
ncbi:hypothetical protein OQA88_3135 [Cercophora sp. LCS_1]